MRTGAGGGDRAVEGMGESFAFEDEALFRLAQELAALGDRIATEHRRRRPWLAEQFGKASLSVLNNSAEAHGEFARNDKSRFYRYALRSATECAAMVVFMRDQQLIDAALDARLRAVLLELMKTLARRAAFFQRPPTPR